MKTRCPSCGATNSLDSLIAHQDAKKAIVRAMWLSGELGNALIQYLALFRPKKTELSFTQVAKRLSELLPYTTTEKVLVDGEEHQASKAAWIWAINQMLENKELKTPLKNHNYLFKVVSSYVFVATKSDLSADLSANIENNKNELNSATGKAVASLQGMKDE